MVFRTSVFSYTGTGALCQPRFGPVLKNKSAVGYINPYVVRFIRGILKPSVGPKPEVSHDCDCLIGFHQYLFFTERPNSAAPGLFGVGWSDRLAELAARLLSESVFPASRVSLRVGHRNYGNASLALNKKHSVGKTPRKGTPNDASVHYWMKLRIPFD